MNIGLYPEITRTYILNNVSEERIFEFYLSVKVDLEDNIISPFRAERIPSARFYIKGGRLRLNDFAGDFHGDCFDAVGKVLGIDSKSKQGFIFVLHTIAKDFRINKYEKQENVNKYYDIIRKSNFSYKENREVKIRVVPRKTNPQDWKFWGKIADENLLKYFNVFMADEIWVQKGDFPPFRAYTYNYKDPAFAYYFGLDAKGEERWKIYYPFREDKRFFTNVYILQGEEQMQIAKFGLITKSYKDVIALKSFGIESVAPSSENSILNADQAFKVKWCYTFPFTLMDYDKQGFINAQKHKRTYGFTPLFFTNKAWNRWRGFLGCKDFTDYVNRFGRDKTKELIYSVYEPYKESINNYHNNAKQELNFIL
jgi:hypothetical protein